VATATVTVVPEPDLGDSVASSGETHGGPRGDRDRDGDSAHPDLTAAPTRPDAEADSEIRPEGEEGHEGNDGGDGNDDAAPRGPGPGPDQANEHG
jgi:hypothetical protein